MPILALKRPTRGEWLWSLVLTSVVASSCIATSLRIGRLSTYPVVDNVNYMSSGCRWLVAFDAGGLAEVWDRVLALPPHSPYAVASCFVAFLLAGVEPWAAHAANGVAMLLAFAHACTLTRGLSVAARTLLIVSLAALPVWSWSVEIVKPDYLMSVLIAVIVGAIVDRCDRPLNVRDWAMAGVLTAACIFVKPVAFAAPFFALGSAALGRLAGERALGLPLVFWRRWKGWIVAGLAPVVVLSPYLAIAGGHVWDYFWENVFGNKSQMWRWNSPWPSRWSYFLFGDGGDRMLGTARWGFVVAASLVLLFALTRRRKAVLPATVGWTVALALLYHFVVFNPMKMREFGLFFQVPLVMAGLRAAVLLSRRKRGSRAAAWARTAVPLTLCVLTLASFKWPFPKWTEANPDTSPSTVRQRTELAESIFSRIAANAQSLPRGSLLLIVGAPGDIDRGLLNVWCARDAVPLKIQKLDRPKEHKKLAHKLASASLVLANEGGTGLTRTRNYVNADRELYDVVARSGEWRSVQRWQAPGTDAHFELFERVGPVPITPVDDEDGDDE